MTERDQFPTTVTDIDEAAQYFENYLREQGTWNDMLPTNVGSFIKRIFSGLSVTVVGNWSRSVILSAQCEIKGEFFVVESGRFITNADVIITYIGIRHNFNRGEIHSRLTIARKNSCNLTLHFQCG